MLIQDFPAISAAFISPTEGKRAVGKPFCQPFYNRNRRSVQGLKRKGAVLLMENGVDGISLRSPAFDFLFRRHIY